jgi:hypothetical protein
MPFTQAPDPARVEPTLYGLSVKELKQLQKLGYIPRKG